ncbi:MAG: hypothetical protein WA810_06800 [Maribacter sp.]
MLVMLVHACKEAASETAIAQDSGWQIDTDSLPKKSTVDAKAQVILNTWKEFAVLERSFDKVYTTEFREDFVLTIEELVENQKKLETGMYPEAFNIPQIKGRQKIFKTYLLKTKGDLEYRQNPKESIIEMITAFNDLRDQFNVVVNNTLPDELRASEKN